MTDCGNPTCTKKIKTNSKAMQCEICDQWWHIECASISDDDYKVVSKGISGQHWFCPSCNKGSVKLLQHVAKLQVELSECKEQIALLKAKQIELNFNHDKQEQYSRKDSVRISGILDPHTKDENTNSAVIRVVNDLGVDLKPEDISVSHRLGKLTSDYDRPVIVKFVRRDTKRLIMMKKKALREKAGHENTYLNDDLTHTRYKICKELRRLSKTVFTRDGKIIVKESETSYTTIDSYKDFCKLNWTEEKLSELGILQ